MTASATASLWPEKTAPHIKGRPLHSSVDATFVGGGIQFVLHLFLRITLFFFFAPFAQYIVDLSALIEIITYPYPEASIIAANGLIDIL